MKRVLVIIAAVVAAWFLLAPTQLGGPVTYVTTYGVSMLPGIKAGDLVLARGQSSYDIGDTIAYHSNTLNVTILHRIVATEGDGFVTKGDNNTWLDPDHPTPADIKGAQWIHIPQGGVWLKRLSSPGVIAGLAFFVLVVGSAVATNRHHRRNRRKTMGSSPGRSHSGSHTLAARRSTLMKVAAVAGALGLLLVIVGWTRPLMVPSTAKTSDTSSTTFSYSATVPPSPAYQSTTVTAPAPIFRKLTNTVVVTYDYKGDPGTIDATAELSTASGWHWSQPLGAQAGAPDGVAQGSVTLDLAKMYSLATAGTAAAGVSMGDVKVEVVPAVTTATGTFRPALPLVLTSDTLRLADPAASLVVTDSTDGSTTTLVPNTVHILKWSIGIWPLRILGLVLLVLGVLALVWLWRMPGQPAESPAAAQRRRYAELIVPVDAVSSPTGAAIDVPDLDSLARIARRYALMVMWLAEPGADVYIVEDETTTYRCVVPIATPTHAGATRHPPQHTR